MSAMTVLDEAGIKAALEAMAAQLTQNSGDAPLALVGIKRGGEPLAKRLAELIAQKVGKRPPVGSVDITLYRDDGFGPHDFPVVGTSQIVFDIPAHTVVLVDDVLFSGRTVRAAMDAILDYGRPKAIRLAVLIDRGLRELPIAPDATGKTIQTDRSQHVTVHLVEAGAEADAVTLAPRSTP